MAWKAVCACVVIVPLLCSVHVSANDLNEFRGHFRCPFAHVWVKHGPEQAARMLGVAAHKNPSVRRLPNTMSCTYNNPFSGAETCFEFHGSTWTEESAKARCDAPPVGGPGTMSASAGCSTTGMVAWCMTEGGTEATPMDEASKSWCQGDWVPMEQPTMSCVYTNPFSGAATCFEFRGSTWTAETAKARCDAPPVGGSGTMSESSGCSTTGMVAWCMTEGGTEATPMDEASKSWCQGDWVPMAPSPSTPPAPTPSAHAHGDGMSSQPLSGGCLLAPGAMGAAHQLAMSTGYSENCPDMPGQQSKYMWPLKWTAYDEQRTMSFGSDEIQYESFGRVWYRLDKNWKRHDIFSQRGILRTVGQSPCDEGQDAGAFSCDKGSKNKNTTVIHKNNKMYFIDWVGEQDGAIANCSWTDLSVIGNIRPDWFMDDRGDATGVQYLGNQHIYYLGQPRLVKQWRKKDFANQYFTMSMQEIAGNDSVHWPLVLNIPGEGFGDDQLKHYSHHRLLADDELAPFNVEEEYMAAGGVCWQRVSEGTGGPPTGQQEHIPSNLEKDDTSWREIMWTGSPVWERPAEEASMGGLQKLSEFVNTETCWDAATSELKLALHVEVGADQTMPWAAVGFLDDAECLMTPRGGGDRHAVHAHADPSTGEYSVTYANIPASLKSGQGEDEFVQSLTAISEKNPNIEGSVDSVDGKLILRFQRTYLEKPGEMHFSFGVGYGSKGYHKTRGCFTVKTLMPCSEVCSAAAVAAQPRCTPSLPGAGDASKGDDGQATSTDTQRDNDTRDSVDYTASGIRVHASSALTLAVAVFVLSQ